MLIQVTHSHYIYIFADFSHSIFSHSYISQRDLITKKYGKNVCGRERVSHQNGINLLPSFYDQNLQPQSISNFEGGQHFDKGQFIGSDSRYTFEDSSNVTSSNVHPLPNGEELSHIVDQVLNSIDAQYSPPLYAVPKPRKISDKEKKHALNNSLPAPESVTSFQLGNEVKCDMLEQNSMANLNTNLINTDTSISAKSNISQKRVGNLSNCILSQDSILENDYSTHIDTLYSTSSKNCEKSNIVSDNSKSDEVQNISDCKPCDRMPIAKDYEKIEHKELKLPEEYPTMKPQSLLTTSCDDISKSIT